MKDVNVHVYERSGIGLKRISAFDRPLSPETKPVVRVLYCGGVHYGEGSSGYRCPVRCFRLHSVSLRFLPCTQTPSWCSQP